MCVYVFVMMGGLGKKRNQGTVVTCKGDRGNDSRNGGLGGLTKVCSNDIFFKLTFKPH